MCHRLWLPLHWERLSRLPLASKKRRWSLCCGVKKHVDGLLYDLNYCEVALVHNPKSVSLLDIDINCNVVTPLGPSSLGITPDSGPHKDLTVPWGSPALIPPVIITYHPSKNTPKWVITVIAVFISDQGACVGIHGLNQMVYLAVGDLIASMS